MPSRVLAVLVFVLSLPSSAVAEPPPAGAAEPSAVELLEQADAILDVIQAHRGIEATRAIARAVLDRDEVLARILEIVDREIPPTLRDAQNRLAVALGLVPADVAWIDRYLELIQAEIAGFYDDHEETFYILGDMPAALQAPIMAHELFHALQDQMWDLEVLIGERQWVTDAALAVQALVEGDALAVMTAYMLGGPDQVTHDSVTRAAMMMSLSGSAVRNTSGAPDSMWAQLIFPYTVGLAFVFAVVEPGDWGPVDAVYTDPPLSTEQTMHPERYLVRDDPTWLEFQIDQPGLGLVAADVFGEFMIGETCAQLLAGGVSRAACDRAADGWDGDRLEVHSFDSDPERDLVVWASVWDSTEEARAYAAVAERLSGPWLGARSEPVASGDYGGAWLAVSERGVLWVEQWGDAALLVLDWHGSADAEARTQIVEAVVADVWSTVSRSRYPEFGPARR